VVVEKLVYAAIFCEVVEIRQKKEPAKKKVTSKKVPVQRAKNTTKR